VPVLALAWVGYLAVVLTELLSGNWLLHVLPSWMLLASTLLFVLLVLELRDKLVLKGDLEVARQIQFGLLPFEPFEQGGTSVNALMRPANTVGGDYFDLIELPEGRLAVAIGDVAGKGMPAALLMALLQGSLRTLLSAGFRGAELMAKLNNHLFTNIPSNRLITLFYAEYQPASGQFDYVNAGHNPPLLLRGAGAAEPLAATGMALGVVADAAFDAPTASLAPKERLFLYTDGITEAFDFRDNEYGEDRLLGFLARSQGLGHRELIEAVRGDVLTFCGSVAPHDDMTLLVLARDA
jgi:sigma-B regulation protein RsbU (phosphoserine phosphatase)